MKRTVMLFFVFKTQKKYKLLFKQTLDNVLQN